MNLGYKFIQYWFANISDPPRILVKEKKIENNQITITFCYFPPITWHGELYSWDTNHTVTDTVTGHCEKEVMQEIYRKVNTIIEWEQRRVSENIGSLISV